MSNEDVPTLARLHKEAFPGFFLSVLGTPFLRQFYRGFLGDDASVTTVACGENGRIFGIAVGTTEPRGFFRRLLLRRGLGFATASVQVAMRHPSYAPRLLRAIRYRGGAFDRPEGALLSSICVDPTAQGAGVGRQLLEAWINEVRSRGVWSAYLTTDAYENDRVNTFYAANGWRLSQTYRTTEGRTMNVYTSILR